MNTQSFDDLEHRAPAAREAALMAALSAQVAHAQASSPAQAERLKGVDARTITSRQALAQLPVLRKGELLQAQIVAREAGGGDPFAGFSASGWNGLRYPRPAKRVFQSPGPLYEPQGHHPDTWRMGRALFAAGFRQGDLIHNSFSYHLTPAGAMMEEGAFALGCAVFPGGIGNSELQMQAMVDLRPQGYAGTPSFLKIVLEAAQSKGVQIPSLTKAAFSGEAFPPSLRDWFATQGVTGYQCYATADVGLIAYETESRQGLVVDEEVIVEIVTPGTGNPVPEGEVGEVVVTVLDPDYPLIRFGTGDLSAVLPGHCPSGRTAPRIKGWMGRADQTTKIRGMFVHPSQVAEIARRHPGVQRARLVVEGTIADERMVLHVESADTSDALAQALVATVRDVTKLRGEVQLAPPGSLPADGKVIEDKRRYD